MKNKTPSSPLTKMRAQWVLSAIIKAIFCFLSLQIILGNSLRTFVLIGFLPPLMVMIAYVFSSHRLAFGNQDLLKISGDSTYYLGFLFTVLSIIAAMGDLGLSPMGDDTLMYIASRFALAMLTTALGMGYRSYIVTFALKDAQSFYNYRLDQNPVTCIPSTQEGEPSNTLQTPDDNLPTQCGGPSIPPITGDKEPNPTASSVDDDTARAIPKNSNSLVSAPQNGAVLSDQYLVELVIKAIADEDIFKKLQDSMNNAIHNFDEMANNAYTIRAALEASASTLVERTGESLQKATETMTQKALDGIGSTLDQANQALLSSFTKASEDNELFLQKLRDSHLQSENNTALHIQATIAKYQESLEQLLNDFSLSVQHIQEQNLHVASETQSAMSSGVQQLAPVLETAINSLMSSATRAHAELQQASESQLNVLHNLNISLENSGCTLKKCVDNISKNYLEMDENFSSLGKALGRLDVDFAQISRNVIGSSTELGQNIRELQKNAGNLSKTSELIKLSNASYYELKNEIEKIRSELLSSSEKYSSLQTAFLADAEKTTTMVGQLSDISDKLNTNASRFNGGINYLNKELEKTSDALASAAEKYEKEKNREISRKPWWLFWKK